MSCGYWLRGNGVWMPIEGVRPGVGYASERARSEFVSVGGVPHSQAALRAARSWTVGLGEQVGPESVAALMMAAQGDAGETWLWDEEAARANLLDPVAVAPRPEYPVVMCGDTAVRSLSAGGGGTPPTTTRNVSPKANLTIRVTGEDEALDLLALDPGTTDALVKWSIPPTPSGVTLTSAELILTASGAASGTIRAHAASGAWTENRGSADSWTSVPAGALLGSVAAAPVTTIPLGSVSAYVGADFSVRLSRTGGTSAVFNGRYTVNPPVLRLTYTSIPASRTVRQHLRAGDYWLTCWTNAAASTQVGTISADGVTLPLIVDAGTGLRRVSIDLSSVTSTADRDWTITITDSTAYLLGGLMLSNLPPSHYLPGHKTPVLVAVEDPSLTLESLYPGDQGMGQRSVVIREDG